MWWGWCRIPLQLSTFYICWLSYDAYFHTKFSVNQHTWISLFFLMIQVFIIPCFSEMVLFFRTKVQNSVFMPIKIYPLRFFLIILDCWSLFGICFHPPKADFIISGSSSYLSTWLSFLLLVSKIVLLLPFFHLLFSVADSSLCYFHGDV